ncbi:hypothetical protein DXG01_004115 [Tephrocybe rancida]|nr:hypothetical protein DXG01_004115 [Tephrocybe rancida]
MAPNEGIFGNGWYKTIDQGTFMKFLAPLYWCASKEGKQEHFYKLLYPTWFDRFPVILNNHYDDNEPGGQVDPACQRWVENLQKRFLQNKMYWVGASDGKGYKTEEYADWESILTLTSDHQRRNRD